MFYDLSHYFVTLLIAKYLSKRYENEITKFDSKLLIQLTNRNKHTPSGGKL